MTTVEQARQNLMDKLRNQLGGSPFRIYDKETRKTFNYQWALETGHSCLDGRQSSVSLRNSFDGKIWAWFIFLQDQKDGVLDDFGFHVTCTFYANKYDYNAKAFSEQYNGQHLPIIADIILQHGLTPKGNTNNGGDRQISFSLYIPIIDEEVQEEQENKVISVIQSIFTVFNELAELRKAEYEEVISTNTNDFRARAEEFVRAKKEKELVVNEVEQVKLTVELIEKLKQANLTMEQVKQIKGMIE